MRITRSLAAAILLTVLAAACDAMGPGRGQPFSEDRQYALKSQGGTLCTATPDDPLPCKPTVEFHADGTARVPSGSLVLEAQYSVRGDVVVISPDESGTAAMRFDLSDGGNTLTDPATGRVWVRYQLLPSLSHTRALA